MVTPPAGDNPPTGTGNNSGPNGNNQPAGGGSNSGQTGNNQPAGGGSNSGQTGNRITIESLLNPNDNNSSAGGDNYTTGSGRVDGSNQPAEGGTTPNHSPLGENARNLINNRYRISRSLGNVMNLGDQNGAQGSSEYNDLAILRDAAWRDAYDASRNMDLSRLSSEVRD